MGSSFLFRARGPSHRARAPYLSGSPSMVGRVSNEAVTAVGLFWRQPFSTRTHLLKATTFPIDVITESKRVHQPPKMPKNVAFGG